MKGFHFFSLAALLFSLNVFAGGADIGEGRSSLEGVPPQPTHSPTPPNHPPMPSTQIQSVTYSRSALSQGDVLSVDVKVQAVEDLDLESCRGKLTSPELSVFYVSLDSCQIVSSENRLHHLVLSYKFPNPTVARSYSLSKIELKTKSKTMTSLTWSSSELVSVAGSAPANAIVGVQSWLGNLPRLNAVYVDQSFALKALFKGPFEIADARLEYTLEGPSEGSFDAALNREDGLETNSTFHSDANQTFVEVPLFIGSQHDWTIVEFSRLSLLTTSLQEVTMDVSDDSYLQIERPAPSNP